MAKKFKIFIFICFIAPATVACTKMDQSTEIDLPEGTTITRILVEKSARKMHVFQGDSLIKTYNIALGFSPEGHKEMEGDGKTPEGVYHINGKNPNSAYFLNLGISYPNAADKARAEQMGKSPGGDIKIHGLPNDLPNIGKAHLLKDWTHGCIAVANEEIRELYDAVPIGTRIEIKP
jgi:murein L,D-transpeptidase YafK